MLDAGEGGTGITDADYYDRISGADHSTTAARALHHSHHRRAPMGPPNDTGAAARRRPTAGRTRRGRSQPTAVAVAVRLSSPAASPLITVSGCG